MIPVSSKGAEDLFSRQEVEMLKKGFKDIIKRKSVTDSAIQLAMSTNSAAKTIGTKLKLSTLKNCLKYEIWKQRAGDKSTV